jgi:hypothetical protein
MISFSQNRRSSERDISPPFPEYEAKVLTAHPRRSKKFVCVVLYIHTYTDFVPQDTRLGP